MPQYKASEIMTHEVTTLSPQTNIYHAIQTLLKKKISGAPVVDDAGRLIGILSEKDCLKIVTAEAFEGYPEGKVSDYMSRGVVSIELGASLYHIVNLFMTQNFRRLPVVDDEGRLSGLVSRRDVLLAIESMRDNSYLYGTEEKSPSDSDGGGVDSAMRVARGR